MADFASMMFQTAAETNKSATPDLAGAYSKGAAIALEKEKIEQAKAAAVAQKQELQSAKHEKFITALQKGSAYEGQARSNYYNKWLPTYRDSLGLSEAYPNEALKFITATPDNMARINTIIARVRDPQDPLREDEALALIRDPSKFADVPPEVLGEATAQLAKAAGTKISAEAQMARQQQQAQQFQTSQETQKSQFEETKFLKKKEGLNKALASEQITALRTGYNRLDQLVPGFTSGEVAPGKVKSITGIASQIPINLLEDENSEVRQVSLGILNSYLKSVSGAAITDSELPRLAQEAGMKIGPLEGGGFTAIFTGTPSPEKFVAGMRGIERKVKEREKQLKRTYGEDVWNEVVEGSGEQETPASTKPAVPKVEGLPALDKPQNVEKIKAFVGDSFTKLQAMSQRYGITVDELTKILNGGQ